MEDISSKIETTVKSFVLKKKAKGNFKKKDGTFKQNKNTQYEPNGMESVFPRN